MGYELSRWAKDLDHPCLTLRTRQVLVAICLIALDEHGEFWMRGKRLIAEHFPDMSYGTYRNCIGRLVKGGLLIKTAHGGGPTAHGRGTGNQYRVNSPVVQNPHPSQAVLPDIVKSPEASPPPPAVDVKQTPVDANAFHKRINELLATDIAPEQMLAIMEFVEETVGSSQNRSSTVTNASEVDAEQVIGSDQLEQDSSSRMTSSGEAGDRLVIDDDQLQPDSSSTVTSCDKRTGHQNGEQVIDSDISEENWSLSVTSPHIHDKKLHEKNIAAAAANSSRSTEQRAISFFDLLAQVLAKAGHPGIRAAQFADLKDFLQNYAKSTGSPPDQRTAEYIVGRVSESKGVRNVVGFVRKVTQDVLTTGEGYVELYSLPSPPPERPAELSPPPDWELLHLAHGEQVSSAQKIWDAVSERLRGQVSRPAFETWVAEASGAAYAEGKFVVGSANTFASEMLRNRMHPLIVKAVREVAGVELEIEYAVVAANDRRECPLCQAGDTKEASAASWPDSRGRENYGS